MSSVDLNLILIIELFFIVGFVSGFLGVGAVLKRDNSNTLHQAVSVIMILFSLLAGLSAFAFPPFYSPILLMLSSPILAFCLFISIIFGIKIASTILGEKALIEDT